MELIADILHAGVLNMVNGYGREVPKDTPWRFMAKTTKSLCGRGFFLVWHLDTAGSNGWRAI